MDAGIAAEGLDGTAVCSLGTAVGFAGTSVCSAGTVVAFAGTAVGSAGTAVGFAGIAVCSAATAVDFVETVSRGIGFGADGPAVDAYFVETAAGTIGEDFADLPQIEKQLLVGTVLVFVVVVETGTLCLAVADSFGLNGP